MAYADLTVYVEDKAGDLGGSPSPAPWWLSPDVDIPSHSGEAVQGANQVQIRVHAHEEPIIDQKITAEVYVGKPGFVLSPTTGTKRIDPGTLLFRPPGVAGTEPVADETGATLSFPWTPSATAADIDGPGHRCLIVRAFPVNVTPPTTAFDVPNEQHEAQHNIEVLTTMRAMAPMGQGGAGTKGDPRRRDEATGLWWEEFFTLGRRRGRHYVAWAFDPRPDRSLLRGLRDALGKTELSDEPPQKVTLETDGNEIDPSRLPYDKTGLFAEDRVLAAAELDLDTKKLSRLVLHFDHSNLPPRSAVVLHGAQWSEKGEPEGGMTVVALAPR
jgi:hypothetical protein